MLQKYRLYQKLLPTKIVKKNSGEHISIYPRSGARGFQRLPLLKYDVLEWESTFTLGLNTVKKYQLYQKMLQTLCRIKFRTKN